MQLFWRYNPTQNFHVLKLTYSNYFHLKKKNLEGEKSERSEQAWMDKLKCRDVTQDLAMVLMMGSSSHRLPAAPELSWNGLRGFYP